VQLRRIFKEFFVQDTYINKDLLILCAQTVIPDGICISGPPTLIDCPPKEIIFNPATLVMVWLAESLLPSPVLRDIFIFNTPAEVVSNILVTVIVFSGLVQFSEITVGAPVEDP
jgi:hypothetical protein